MRLHFRLFENPSYDSFSNYRKKNEDKESVIKKRLFAMSSWENVYLYGKKKTSLQVLKNCPKLRRNKITKKGARGGIT